MFILMITSRMEKGVKLDEKLLTNIFECVGAEEKTFNELQAQNCPMSVN